TSGEDVDPAEHEEEDGDHLESHPQPDGVLDRWDRNPCEPGPPTGTVEFGRLEELLGDGAEGGAEDHHPDSDLGPEDENDDDRFDQMRLGQPAECQPVEPYLPQPGIDDSVRPEESAEQDADQSRGEHRGHEVDGPPQTGSLDILVEQERDHQG